MLDHESHSAATADMSRSIFGRKPTAEEKLKLQENALHKSAETTTTIHNCLRVAEEMEEEANKTLLHLHQQGDQIRRTQETAVILELELSKGEKLLSSIGGLFSTWKPKKVHEVAGPKHKERATASAQAETGSTPQKMNPPSTAAAPGHKAGGIQHQVQVEHEKQDEALTGLSSVLDKLKEMSRDMGTEIGRQSESLSHLQADVTELENRVKNANVRGRQLLHK